MASTDRDAFIRQLVMLDFDYLGDTFSAQRWGRGAIEIAVPKVLKWLDAEWANQQLALIEADSAARAA